MLASDNEFFLIKSDDGMPQRVCTFIVRREDLAVTKDKHAELERQKGKRRLDTFLLAQEAVSYSRSQIRKLILDGSVTVNGQQVKSGYWLREADTIEIVFPEPRPLDLKAEQIPLDILFEDEQVLVLNKAVGMVVHPSPGHHTGTLVHALLHHCRELSGIGGVQRPGIVHRLDRDTSGVMLVAKTNEAHTSLSDQLRTRQLTRVYAAVAHGHFTSLSGEIEAPIARHRKDRKRMAVDPEKGRYALSLYRVVQQFPEYTLLQIELKTGRTHQIRVHLKHIHHPIVGDPVYGNASKSNLIMSRQALHAQTITFLHPVRREQMTFTAALPEDMQRLIEKLNMMRKM